MEVIYEAPKCFWKWRCTLDVCIVHHTSFDVIEIIAYEPSIAKEASRIFVDCSALTQMVSDAEVHERAKKLKEPFLRRKENPDVNKLEHQALNDAKAELIVNRLQIGEFLLESKTLNMVLVPTFCDMEKGRPLLVCSKPPGLRSYSWAHSSVCTSKDVAQSLAGLDSHLTGAKKDNVAAAIFEQTARSALSVRERWRVALVFTKVAKGRRLSVKDSKIWDVVSHKLRCQDSVEAADVHAAVEDTEDDRTIRQHGHSTPRSRRSSEAGCENHKLRSSPKQLSPREAVDHHVQSLTPRSYSVTGAHLHHVVSDLGANVSGISGSLERSVGTVVGASLDTRNKHYRVAASVELDSGDLGEETVRMHSFRSRPTSPNPSHQRLDEIAKAGHNLSAPHSHSRPQSPYRGRSMRAHSPISRIPNHEAADAPPAMKRKHAKQTVLSVMPTACDLANQQLTATRMLRSLAGVGASVRNSIGASFGDDSAKVYVEVAAAAVSDEDEGMAALRSSQKPAAKSSTVSRSPDATTCANAGSGSPARLAGSFGGGGFLSVDAIRSMVLKHKSTQSATTAAVAAAESKTLE